MSEEIRLPFRALLRQERKAIPGLSQARLAEKAQLSWREISDLETGRTQKPHEDTVRRLADVLNLAGLRRDAFFAAAGHERHPAVHPATSVVNAIQESAALAGRGPLEWLAFVVSALDARGVGAAQAAVAAWQAHEPVESAWLAWVDRLITLTAAGRLQPVSQRPALTAADGPFLSREAEIADLATFARRAQSGRGGLALVLGPAGIGKSSLIINALDGLQTRVQVHTMTLDRNEAGYRGWGRLLAPLWITLRRTELAPADLLHYAEVLDDILLTNGKAESASRRYVGEIADAVAALLIHVAAAEALIVVIDDAHRGGASSDLLVLQVARRVNAHRVGIIAAARPDELERESPLLGYSAEAWHRSAADVVLPVHVPPLGHEAARILLEMRTGAEPPTEIVDEVLRRTGGCPQFIKGIAVQHPAAGGPPDWLVGKFDADGRRALESTIASRSKVERSVLEAAAVSEKGGFAEPGVVAAIAELASAIVEAVLDRERQHGPILMPHIDGYRFQHDNWIDALVGLCATEKLRAYHARCLELLRAEPAPDPLRLARHAKAAGAGLIGESDFAALLTTGADTALSDYAFGIAAEWYEAAARHAAGEALIDLLIKQAGALRFAARWNDASSVLKHAVSQARILNTPGREALALIHLERLTWSYGLDERDLTQRMREVLEHLPCDQTALRAHVEAALAMRLSITPRNYEDEQADLARKALQQVPSIGDPRVRADILLGIRHGLQDSEPPERLLELDKEVLDLALKEHSMYHMEEALSASVVDVLRCGRLRDLHAAVRELRDFTRKSAGPLVTYTCELIEAMLALARGDFELASQHTDQAIELSAAWGASMAGEALMAQTGWRLYETGQLDGLTDFLGSLPQQDVSSLNGPVWSLAEGIIHAEQMKAEEAIRKLREVCADTQDFRGLPRGPGRIGILATAAMVVGHPVVSGALPADEAARLGVSLYQLLEAHPDKLVVAGWPAVLLGSKSRYIGLALLAAGHPEEAAEYLAEAAEVNGEFAVLYTRTKFDLARALLQMPQSYSQGIVELELVRQRAADLKMPTLAAQAAQQLESAKAPR